MRRWIGATALLGSVLAAVILVWPVVGVAATDPNAYFNTVVSRPDYWLSNALRSQVDIDSVSAARPNAWVTYDSTMDAAKAVIPAFNNAYGLMLGAPVGATDTTITFSAPLTSGQQSWLISGRALLLDDEIVTVNLPRGATWGTQFPTASSVDVLRAQFGTTATTHAAGLTTPLSQNSLLDYLRVPLGTADGQTYLFTWDVYWDPSYLGTDLNPGGVGHKEFQLTGGQKSSIWLEMRTRADGVDGLGKTAVNRSQVLGVADCRNYDDPAMLIGAAGSNVTSVDSLAPQASRFTFSTGRWTRYWVFIDQRANDYDRMTMWIADSQVPPVKVFDGLTLRVPGSPSTIASWWLEQNSSFDLYRGSRRDLVSYVRNFAALKGISLSDVASLLVQPAGGVAGPAPPPKVWVVH